MVKQFDTLIIGATFYGCGLAAAIPGAAVIEPSIVAGGDFALTFNPGCDWDCPLTTPGANEFRDELKQRRALLGGRSNVAAFSPVLTAWVLKRKLPVELSCEIIGISEREVKVINVEGVHSYRAERVIDARSVPGSAKYLTAVLFCETPVASHGAFELTPGCRPDVVYLSYKLPAATGWADARREFAADWQKRPAELKQAKVMLIGSRFDYRNYPNPAVALETGLKAGGAQ